MKKFRFLLKYGLKKRVGRKSFVIANIVIAILLIAIINIPSIIGLFSNEEVKLDLQIAVESNYSYPIVDDLNVVLNEGLEKHYFYVHDNSGVDGDTFWESDVYDVLLIFTGTEEMPVLTIYSKEQSYNTFILQTIELQLIRYQFESYVPLQSEFRQAPDYEDPEAGMIISSLSTILVLPLFILITMATQFVGVDIIEEKSTKAIETIISSVPANIHFLSKIASAISFVLIQGGLIMVYTFLASLVGKFFGSQGVTADPAGDTLLGYVAEVIPNWPLVLLFAILFVLIGTLFYLVIAALFASMAVTQEDYQQFQSPLMFMLLGGFYIAIFTPMAGADVFLKIMSFVPLFSPMVAPVAYAAGAISTWDAIIGLGIMVISFVGLVYVASPVYRVAILSYDQTKFMKRVKSYFKKGFNK